MRGRGRRTTAACGLAALLAFAAGPAAHAASKPKLRDLTRSEAVKVAKAGFGPLVTQPLWKPPQLKPGERITGYRGVRTAVIDRPGTKAHTVVDSSVPLVAPNAGARRPVDISLVRRGARFAPRNPAADSSYGASLASGFSLGDAGVTIRPALANPQAPAQLLDNRVFYANAATDTDVLVGPHPTGFQVFFQLRSAASPERLPLVVEGDGISLRGSTALRGGADVLRGGRVIARIAPPYAIDAAGRTVPVAYRVMGTTLEVVATHLKRKVEYPILVDPHVMDQQTWFLPGYNIAGWHFGTPWPSYFWGSQAGAWGKGLYIASGAPNATYGHGTWGWFNYPVPGTAHAFRADFNPVLHRPGQGGVCMTVGMHRGGDWTRFGRGDNVSAGTTGGAPISTCDWQNSTYYRVCLNASCTADHSQTGNTVGFQQWMYGHGVRAAANYTMLGGVTVFLEDYDVPSITGGPSDNAAFGPEHPWSYQFTQRGLGVNKVVADSPTAPLWDQAGTMDIPCWGTPWGRCATSSGGTIRYGNLPYGSHRIRIRAYTATGRVGTREWNVHIGYFWASWRYGGANRTLDTQAEVDAVINLLSSGSEASRDVVWGGLSDADKATVVAADGYVRWGEEPPLNTEGEDGSYNTWDGEGSLDSELDTWIPPSDQEEAYDQQPAAAPSAGPAVIVIVGACKAFCDDAVKKGVSPIFKKVVKSKKPRPRHWATQKPPPTWTQRAGRNPSRELGRTPDMVNTKPTSGGSGDWAAHHIVPVGHRGARLAQLVLENCNIHPNSADNGVWLPANTEVRDRLGTVRPAHSRVHSTHYIQNVNKLMFVNRYRGLSGAFAPCDRVIAALRLLRQEIQGNRMAW